MGRKIDESPEANEYRTAESQFHRMMNEAPSGVQQLLVSSSRRQTPPQLRVIKLRLCCVTAF